MTQEFSIDLSIYPALPGVYLMRDGEGNVLYVGKAVHLRNRLRSYFVAGGDGRAQIPRLLQRVRSVETIVTDTEKEALILENTLIKKYTPRYNIELRDDKTYVSLRIDLSEEFPALQVVRQVDPADKARFFGPFASAGAVRDTLKLIYRVFPLRHYPAESCRKRTRPCLFYQIGQCSAPCHGRISPQAYRVLVDGVIDLLSGREKAVLDQLRQRMDHASATMAFEEAATLRDQIRAIERTLERQKVVDRAGGDLDVVGLHRDGGEVEIAMLFVRQGKLVDRRTWALQWQLDEAELLADFLRGFYSRDLPLPERLLLPLLPQGAQGLQAWLSDRRGCKVQLQWPRRGEKLRLVRLANRNAREAYRQRGERQQARQEVLQDVQRKLYLRRLPQRMECFDISTVQGALTVASMAVLIGGEPAPSHYRRYRIKTVAGTDDYAAMYEVLSRRLRRSMSDGELPDLILVDGGKGQLGVLDAVLQELGLQGQIDLAGIAKSRIKQNMRGKAVEKSQERLFVPGRANPVTLRQGSAALFLLERLRDEAHRFAITYHRRLRHKAALKSGLDEIPGIGPKRRQQLLKGFGSLKKIKAATVDELVAVARLPRPVAQTVYAFFHRTT